MSVNPRDLLFYAGGECLQRFGTLVWRPRLSHDLVPTFTRSGAVGPFIGSDGVLRQASANRPRIEWVDLDGDGARETPGLLLEETRTNLVLQSEDFGTTWGTVGTPTRSAGAHTASGVTLDLIGDDDGAASEYYTQTVTFGSDGNRTVSIHVKEGTSPGPSGSLIVLRDTSAGVSRLSATVTFSGGVPSVAFTAGAQTREPELLADGVYRLFLRATGVVSANTNQLQVRPTTSTASETGNIYAGGVQAENSTLVSSYVATTTGTVARPAETFYAPFTAAPQEMTVYVKLLARQASGTSSDNAVLHIGSATAGADPRLVLFDGPNGYRAAHDNGTTAVTSADTLTAVSPDDLVELRAVLRSDGSLFLGQSIDEAAESVTATTAAAALGSAWAGERIYINSAGTTEHSLNNYLSVKIAAGTKTMAEMRSIFPRAAS